MSEIASIISKALISLHIIKSRLTRAPIDTKTLIRNFKSCEYVLRIFLEELDMYREGKSPETEAVEIIIEAYGDTDVERIRKHLSRAIQGLKKLVRALEHKSFDTDILRDKDVAELEDVLQKLSDLLSRKVSELASGIYAF